MNSFSLSAPTGLDDGTSFIVRIRPLLVVCCMKYVACCIVLYCVVLYVVCLIQERGVVLVRGRTWERRTTHNENIWINILYPHTTPPPERIWAESIIYLMRATSTGTQRTCAKNVQRTCPFSFKYLNTSLASCGKTHVFGKKSYAFGSHLTIFIIDLYFRVFFVCLFNVYSYYDGY